MSYTEKELQKRIGQLVTEARVKQGLSRPKLAEKAGIGLRTLHGFEHGETWPQATTLKAICDALAWDTHLIDRALKSGKAPAEIVADDLAVDPWANERPRFVSDLTDAELLSELTYRMRLREEELEQLRKTVNNVTPIRRTREFDESIPHAAHPGFRLETSQYDDLGEEPQD